MALPFVGYLVSVEALTTIVFKLNRHGLSPLMKWVTSLAWERRAQRGCRVTLTTTHGGEIQTVGVSLCTAIYQAQVTSLHGVERPERSGNIYTFYTTT